jgi:phosphoglycolate phosphatase
MLLIFDLDGTLIDSRFDIAAACNAALVAIGKTALPVEKIATFVGDGAHNLMRRALGEDASDSLIDAALPVLTAYYLAHPVEHTRWLPGAAEALETLAHEHTIALATNKGASVAHAILGALGVIDRFAAVIGGGELALKPDPACIHAIAKQTGFAGDIADIWMIGDGPQDIGAGKAAGSTTVAVLGGFHPEGRLRALRPDHLLASLGELGPLLAGLKAPPNASPSQRVDVKIA